MDDLLKRLDPSRVAGALMSLLTGMTRLLLRYSQERSPVATGNLRRAGFMLVSGDGLSAMVGYGTKYAGVVEDGSRAHVIAAHNRASLAFVPNSFATLAQATTAIDASRGTGQVKKSAAAHALAIFPKFVNHPGTDPNPFLVEGWEDAKPDVLVFMGEVGQRYIKGEEPAE